MDQDTNKNDKKQAPGQSHKSDEGISEQAKITFGRIPKDNTHEEMAEEITTEDFREKEVTDNHQVENKANINSAFGWIGVVLSVLSFFIVPIIFGGAGIILGFAAKTRDAEILGNSAIITGAASIVITMFIVPFV